MAKNNKRRGPAAPVKTPAEVAAPSLTPAQLSRRGYRETVDALVIAFVLAFLIRTFEAEAFVIPTGSMAPTLMGRHKDVFCDQCGVRYKVNSSDDRPRMLEAARRGGLTLNQTRQLVDGVRCVAGECPQCRYLMPLADNIPNRLVPPGTPPADQTAHYSGDRLVVSKYSYNFAPPERWDVAVFKYPGNSQENYIKRIVGLPGEELRVYQGDLYTRSLGSDEPFRIARKPPKVAMAMRQFVHDSAHESAVLNRAGWPLAWSGGEAWEAEIDEQPVKPTGESETLGLRYRGQAPAGQTRWLRYRNTPPVEAVWNRLAVDPKAEIGPVRSPQLVTDFTPYNTRLNLDQALDNGRLSLAPRPRNRRRDGDPYRDLGRLGVHWVGDLMLEADLRVESAAEVSLDVVEAGVHYGVTIDTATGEATLWRQAFESSDREPLDSAATPVKGSGTHAVRLANFDNRLLLWIDGRLIETDASYEDPNGAVGPATEPRSGETDEGDLAPAGVGVTGGQLVVERLRLWRDGYYFATSHLVPSLGSFGTDMPAEAFEDADRRSWEDSLLAIAEEPRLWYAYGNRRRVDFPVEQEQLFVMGDNSGFSSDARLWAGGGDGGRPGGPYLERKQLVGKAVCVYWPHAWYSVPFTRQLVPAWPNFQDMRLVR